MGSALQGTRVAFLVANEGVEEVELTRPWAAVQKAGGTPHLVAPEPGTVHTMNHLDRSGHYAVDRTTAEVAVDQYAAVFLPGGVANPDQLRQDGAAISFLRRFVASGRPVAVICHGPWTLVEADVVRGRTLTSWSSLRTDIVNAGGLWVDEEVHICTNGPNVLVSSRKPDDLEAFCAAAVAQIAGSEAGQDGSQVSQSA